MPEPLTIRWDDSMGCYRVSEPNFAADGPVRVFREEDVEDLAVSLRVLTTAYLRPAAQEPENYEAQEILGEIERTLAKWPKASLRSDLGFFNPRTAPPSTTRQQETR